MPGMDLGITKANHINRQLYSSVYYMYEIALEEGVLHQINDRVVHPILGSIDRRAEREFDCFTLRRNQAWMT